MNDVDQGHASFYHVGLEIAIDEKSPFRLWNTILCADNLTRRLLRMDNGISQDDLNALFKDMQIEPAQKPKTIVEAKDVETLDGGETLSQDQIDELLKSFLND